jgi:hypothetical protein
MSLPRPVWLTPAGDAGSGASPTRTRGDSLNEEQQGALKQAYARFCTDLNNTTFPNGFYQRQYSLPHGATAMITSISGQHQIQLKASKENPKPVVKYSLEAVAYFCSAQFPYGATKVDEVVTAANSMTTSDKVGSVWSNAQVNGTQVPNFTHSVNAGWAENMNEAVPGNRDWSDRRETPKWPGLVLSWWMPGLGRHCPTRDSGYSWLDNSALNSAKNLAGAGLGSVDRNNLWCNGLHLASVPGNRRIVAACFAEKEIEGKPVQVLRVLTSNTSTSGTFTMYERPVSVTLEKLDRDKPIPFLDMTEDSPVWESELYVSVFGNEFITADHCACNGSGTKAVTSYNFWTPGDPSRESVLLEVDLTDGTYEHVPIPKFVLEQVNRVTTGQVVAVPPGQTPEWTLEGRIESYDITFEKNDVFREGYLLAYDYIGDVVDFVYCLISEIIAHSYDGQCDALWRVVRDPDRNTFDPFAVPWRIPQTAYFDLTKSETTHVQEDKTYLLQFFHKDVLTHSVSSTREFLQNSTTAGNLSHSYSSETGPVGTSGGAWAYVTDGSASEFDRPKSGGFALHGDLRVGSYDILYLFDRTGSSSMSASIDASLVHFVSTDGYIDYLGGPTVTNSAPAGFSTYGIGALQFIDMYEPDVNVAHHPGYHYLSRYLVGPTTATYSGRTFQPFERRITFRKHVLIDDEVVSLGPQTAPQPYSFSADNARFPSTINSNFSGEYTVSANFTSTPPGIINQVADYDVGSTPAWNPWPYHRTMCVGYSSSFDGKVLYRGMLMYRPTNPVPNVAQSPVRRQTMYVPQTQLVDLVSDEVIDLAPAIPEWITGDMRACTSLLFLGPAKDKKGKKDKLPIPYTTSKEPTP